MKNLIKTFESFNADDYNRMEMDYHDKAEMEAQNYMFFDDLQTIKRYVDQLLEMDQSQVDSILKNGHDWAENHIATAKDDIEEVANFLMNEVGDSSKSKMRGWYPGSTVMEEEINESDTLVMGGLAKNLYSDLTASGKKVDMTYQNDKLGSMGKAKYLKNYGEKDSYDVKIAYHVQWLHVFGLSEDEMQELIDKYSSDEVTGEIARTYASTEPFLTFKLNQETRRSDFNLNRGFFPKANKNDRRREERLEANMELAEGAMYSCNECGSMYEAYECNEDMTCEGCGGSISQLEEGWGAAEEAKYSCNECGMTYEAYECNEDMTCEGCGCKLTESY